MSTKVIYDGPEGQANHEVGVQSGRGDLLEPGAVYAVDAELADRLIGSDARFSKVTSYDDLTLDQLYQVAQVEDIEGRSDMDRDELLAAIRDTAPEPIPADELREPRTHDQADELAKRFDLEFPSDPRPTVAEKWAAIQTAATSGDDTSEEDDQ